MMKNTRAARKKEWFDEHAFWRDLYQFMFSEKRFTEAAEQVPELLKLVNPKGKIILDLCCGPGRFSIPLAQRGFHVTGVDATRYLLDRARARAKAAKVTVEWVRQDMRDFVRPNRFDLVINLFTSFGYFDNKNEDAQVLTNIFRSLRPGGSVLIDVMGKEILARIAQSAICEVLADGSKLLQLPQVYDGWTRIRNEWILIRDGAAKTFEFHHTIYSGQELNDLLSRAGFAEVTLFGGLNGEDYGLNAKRLVALATKKL